MSASEDAKLEALQIPCSQDQDINYTDSLANRLKTRRIKRPPNLLKPHLDRDTRSLPQRLQAVYETRITTLTAMAARS